MPRISKKELDFEIAFLNKKYGLEVGKTDMWFKVQGAYDGYQIVMTYLKTGGVSSLTYGFQKPRQTLECLYKIAFRNDIDYFVENCKKHVEELKEVV